MRLPILLVATLALIVGQANAMALRVAPTLLNIKAPASAAQITLRNTQDRPLNVQLRVFRWSQHNGEEHLEPTNDVAVSPPITVLNPGTEYIARILRISHEPIRGEESYRLLVDEIPDRSSKENGTVSFVLRQSIPIFFTPAESLQPHIDWSADFENKFIIVTARNNGGKRQRIAKFTIKDESGATLVQRTGLFGYVLAGSEARWKLQLPIKPAPGATLYINADGESEAIHAALAIPVRP
jgi:fimbrial chaperone protein